MVQATFVHCIVLVVLDVRWHNERNTIFVFNAPRWGSLVPGIFFPILVAEQVTHVLYCCFAPFPLGARVSVATPGRLVSFQFAARGRASTKQCLPEARAGVSAWGPRRCSHSVPVDVAFFVDTASEPNTQQWPGHSPTNVRNDRRPIEQHSAGEPPTQPRSATNASNANNLPARRATQTMRTPHRPTSTNLMLLQSGATSTNNGCRRRWTESLMQRHHRDPAITNRLANDARRKEMATGTM